MADIAKSEAPQQRTPVEKPLYLPPGISLRGNKPSRPPRAPYPVKDQGDTFAPEAGLKLQRKATKREAKGIYYFAAEYQRQKQEKRRGPERILNSIIAPFTLQARAFQIWFAARRANGFFKLQEISNVITSDFARKAMEGPGNITQQDRQVFRAKSEVHRVYRQYELDGAQRDQAKAMLSDLFKYRGNLLPNELNKYRQKSGLRPEEFDRLLQVVKESPGQTVDQMKDAYSDEALFGSLDAKQQELAGTIARGAWGSTAAMAGRLVLIAFLATNPGGGHRRYSNFLDAE